MQKTAEIIDASRIDTLFRSQKQRSLTLRTEPIAGRRKRLQALQRWIIDNRERIKSAVHNDFRKPLLEVDSSEIYPALAEVRHAITNLESWSAATKVDAPITYLGTRSEIRYEPKGVCLIISPWNFPFNLSVCPLISCLAAGNTAVLKPSEMTPSTSTLLREMMSELFDNDVVAVAEGGPEVSTALLKLPFDHIFFTGSPAIGKIVMKAAAENLTSVTLELGGKTPTIIDSTADLDDAAHRIAFGKFINNGQTCIAPDYLLVDERIVTTLVEKLKNEINALFGDNGEVNENSANYARIVNPKNFARLNEMVRDAIEKGATVEWSGPIISDARFIHPMLLSNLSPDSRLLEEEIFGPLLPIVTFREVDEATAFILARPKPLAMYIFSKSKTFQNVFLGKISTGGVCINDCLLQFTHPELPFGGVNTSGIGKSHGRYGFLAFSNEKPVLRQKKGWTPPYLLYPPYLAGKKKIIDILLKWF